VSQHYAHLEGGKRLLMRILQKKRERQDARLRCTSDFSTDSAGPTDVQTRLVVPEN
jgi:hypothetical protein